ncbi:MAG: hypothetical protein GX868_12235 [Actinobacteria bacterium]|nr:hypothetical protein [Actinomycetota bacterium]
MGETNNRRVGAQRLRNFLSVVAAGAVVAGCVPEAAAPPIPPAASECGAASFSCNLPYPSDTWLVADPSTRTGVRLDVPEGAVGAEVLAMFGDRDQIADAEVGADGFSSVTPVALQLPDALAPDAIPADGGDVVQAWDITSGERIRIHAEVSQHLNDERGVRNIVVAYPATRFEPGHRVFVAVLPGVVAFGGNAAAPSGSKAWASAQTRDAAARFVPQVAWQDVLAATSFTVRSDESFSADVDRMVAEVHAADLGFRNITIAPSPLGGAVMVSGEVQSLDYRQSDGTIARDGSARAAKQWLSFVMVLPERPASPKGAPVMVYGHGIIAMKESMLVVSRDAAAKGYAVIAIDKPNHGTRVGPDGGHIAELNWPSNLSRLQSLMLQAILDDISLITAVTKNGGVFDVSPNTWFGPSGDGVADLDLDSIYYSGTSLGGVLGSAVVALEPAIDAAYLQVPGTGIIDVLFHSMAWGLFQSVVPGNAPYGDNHALTFFAQNLLDRADATNYLHRIRERGTPVFVSYGLDDGLVRNETTERMAEILELPFVGRQYDPLPAALLDGAVDEMPADGNGFHQVPTDQMPDWFLRPLQTHIAFLEPASHATLDRWLDDRIVEIRARG